MPLSTADETRRAVDAAQAAFPAWRDTPAPVRGPILFRAQAILDKEKDELARLLTREEGKTVKEALGEIQRTINILEYIAAEGRRMGGQTVPSELPQQLLLHGAPAAWASWPASRPGTSRWPSRSGRSRPRWSAATPWSSSRPPSPPPPRPPSSPSSSAPGCPKGVLNMVLGSGRHGGQRARSTTTRCTPSPSRAATRWAPRSTPAARGG